MASQHEYTSQITWTGNTGKGTRNYKGYDRSWNITTPGKPVVHCSNDPLLGGNPTLPNPEDLLLNAVSACHMLWYLHLASSAGIVVTAYVDNPVGLGELAASGAGRFVGITLKPSITVIDGTDITTAESIHQDIHQYCFIARSLNFPVAIEAHYESG